jgi:uncharacterized MnhB-related membrane protein
MNSIDLVEIVVSVVLILLAVLTVSSKKMITSIIYLSLVSMFAAVSFAIMRAPDVAITEAVIGSGLVTAVFLFTLLSIRKAGEEK